MVLFLFWATLCTSQRKGKNREREREQEAATVSLLERHFCSLVQTSKTNSFCSANVTGIMLCLYKSTTTTKKKQKEKRVVQIYVCMAKLCFSIWFWVLFSIRAISTSDSVYYEEYWVSVEYIHARIRTREHGDTITHEQLNSIHSNGQ